MGNVYSGIKNYIYGEEKIETPDQMVLNTNEIREKNLEERIRSLQDQLDQDRDNSVTKDELKEYFEKLSSKIDQNSDGVITHDELESYVETQLESSQGEIEKWKTAYENLHDKYEQLLDQLRSEETRVIDVSQVSPQALKDYIKSEIINTDANMGLVPDALEKKIYLAVYKTIMNSLEGLFNTTSVDLLNHRISFAIQPVPPEERVYVGTRMVKTSKSKQ